MLLAVSKPIDSRLAAAHAISAVIDHGQSLAQALPAQLSQVQGRDHSLVQELSYGVLRHYFSLQALVEQLLKKPLRAGTEIVNALLLTGLYQLLYTRIPPHAAVSSVVTAARQQNHRWAGGLINAVLRSFIRQQDPLLGRIRQDLSSAQDHPSWLIQQLQADWPRQWQAILEANNARPPQTLRVNLSRCSRGDYLDQLRRQGLSGREVPYSATALILDQPVRVDALPGFEKGLVSVQDGAAQFAAELLDCAPRQRVLDACAAPGGKTCHLLEREASLTVHAVDSDRMRLKRLEQNLSRLQLSARTINADVLQPASWWDNQDYDRILLDAPCSATGVIRRHPDIKLLRRATDSAALARQQYRMLALLWPLLKPGGRLLYATCSILAVENQQLVERFLQQQADAEQRPILGPWGHKLACGRQILPGEHGMDGFYYACLAKKAV